MCTTYIPTPAEEGPLRVHHFEKRSALATVGHHPSVNDFQFVITIERSNLAVRPTSNDPINGEIVSGSSGATAPSSFQFFVRPALTDEACSGEVVRLKRMAIELAS